jgi:hypothetical protein
MSSFQGPGTSVSGYSGQFTVGYSNGAGNINGYAPVAGNTNGYAAVAGNINGYAPSAGQTNQLQLNQGGLSANWWWQGQGGTPGHLWGSNDGYNHYVYQYNQMYMGTAGYTNGNIGGYAPVAGNTNGNAANANNAYAALQQGAGLGSNAQLVGAMGFQRASRAATGNYSGFYAGYNQQGTTCYANFNASFGGYWGANAIACIYQTNGGFSSLSCGNWQGAYQILMQGQFNNQSGYTWQVSG